MKFGIVGPISQDLVVFLNGQVTKKFGAVAYTALALAKLLEDTDHKVICLSHISAENLDKVTDLLRHPNISMPTIASKQHGTAIELRYINDQERMSRQKSVMSPFVQDELQFIADCDYVLFMPLNDTDIPLSFMQEFRKISKATIIFDVHGMITGVDEHGNRFKKYWKDAREWLANIDIIKMNDKEVGWASSTFTQKQEDYLNYAVDTIKHGLLACWITFGNQSSLVTWQRDERILWANVPVTDIAPVVDTIGCGDTASAGFMYLYAKIHSPLIAVISGNMLGSVKATVFETSQLPTRPEMRGMIGQYYYNYLHLLLDQFLSRDQLIIHEWKAEIENESIMYIANEYRYDNGADNARGSHRQGLTKPWS